MGRAYVEKVQLVDGTSDAVGKEQQVALAPSDFDGRVLEAHAGTLLLLVAHFPLLGLLFLASFFGIFFRVESESSFWSLSLRQ